MTSFSRIVRLDPNPTVNASATTVTWSDGKQRTFLSADIADLREYFTRPKPPSPRERAVAITDQACHPHYIATAQLVDLIAAAIEDAARRGVDWESDET